MAVRIEEITVSEFSQNARIVWDELTREAIVIDPGGEAKKILSFISNQALKVQAILLTHSHIDHCGAVAPLLQTLGPVELYAHPSEKMFRERVTTVASLYGLGGSDYHNCPDPTQLLEGGEILEFLGQEIQVFATPGHSPGSLSFYFPQMQLVISGDLLFRQGIGRTDLPGGDEATLLASIAHLMRELPGNTRVLSGHGPETTLASERETNPFLMR